ncbi:hypothetical protein [Clostridium sp.]|uniref:hypothetical protein n=1 Tax=Clostridium sp. TaxID=1506 RepID=UPI00258499C3|nr:hypothetical protein [Clostridium sp.]MCI6140249.1 hypothetical protein [Clostridium sp.]
MTKFEAIIQLPVKRFADLFYEMALSAGSTQRFEEILMEDFPEDLLPELRSCSTGEDLINVCLGKEDNSNSHQ